MWRHMSELVLFPVMSCDIGVTCRDNNMSDRSIRTLKVKGTQEMVG